MANCPPRAQRVFEQELHHVVLSKKLGNRCKIFSTNFPPTIIHFFFSLRLPKLVHPAKGIICAEEYRGEISNDSFELMTPFWRERYLYSRIISTKDAWEH